jgi:twitching motility protein PilT
MSDVERIARPYFTTRRTVGSERLPSDVLELLTLALRRGATDVLLAVDRPPSFRVSARLSPVEEVPPPGVETIVRLAESLLGEQGLAELERHRDRDFAFEVTGLARFRGSFYYQRGGLALAIRVLPASIQSPDELGLPSAVSRLAALPRGLILVTGPTGSGKSTTLAAIIEVINRTHAKHIVTIEDPVEFVHEDKLSRIEQREVGRDTPTFARALRGVFRQSPDVVMVGEVRDVETIQTVLSLAETGHLTLATLHTSSCAKTIHRIIDVFPEKTQLQIRAQLALSLEGVLSLALLPRVEGGLVLATEIMLGTPAVRAMIRDGRVHQIYSAIQSGQEFGMYTMNHSLARLIRRGQVTVREAEARSSDVEELRQLLIS